MDLKQYVEDATTTESLIEVVNVYPALLASTLQIMIAAGNVLDQIKKNVFYNKPFNDENLTLAFGTMVASLTELRDAIMNHSTIAPEPTMYNPRVFHSIIGIATEAVELLEALGNPDEFDTVNFLEELGDLNWYEAIGIDAVNGNFEDVLQVNIEKLRARYPDKFNKDAAVNRDLDKERDILSDLANTEDGC